MTTPNEIKPATPAEALDGGRCAVDAGFGVWQPIESAPKDQTRILCSYRGNRPFIARWRNDFSVFMDDWDSWRDATHWMPLPASPNVQDQPRGANATGESSSL